MSLSLAALIPWVATLAMGFPAAPPGQEFERGRTAFLRGEYERAVTIIYPLVYPELRLESEAEALQAHRMLGVSYLFEGKQAEARGEFRKLLELSPDYRFDPLLDPSRVVEFFNAIVREQQAQLGDIEARLKKREDELSRHHGEVLERRVERRSYAVNFIPFGAGQFQNQQRGKAWAFLGVEAALASVSLGAFVYNFAKYGARPGKPCLDMPTPVASGAAFECPPSRVDHSGENASRSLMHLQVASGAAFFAVALWGAIDALHYFKSDVSLGETYVPATSPPQGAWRLVPTVGPVAQGASLSYTF
jgi:tetratricopeptide (TPR) repeat protein